MKKIGWNIFYIGKKGLLWLIYLIFACYILYLVVNTQTVMTKFILTFLGIFVLGIVVLFEYLKHTYEDMIYALTVECDIIKAKSIKHKLERRDIFRGFKHSIHIFESLLLLDEGKYEQCLTHLDAHKKFFHSTLDYLFIYYHTQMRCYFFLKDSEMLQKNFLKLANLKSVKKKQMRQLFSWHEIEGINYFSKHRYQKSLKEFSLVDTQRLNNRELTYCLFMKGHCLLRLGQSSEGYRLLKEAKKIGNSLSVVQTL